MVGSDLKHDLIDWLWLQTKQINNNIKQTGSKHEKFDNDSDRKHKSHGEGRRHSNIYNRQKLCHLLTNSDKIYDASPFDA